MIIRFVSEEEVVMTLLCCKILQSSLRLMFYTAGLELFFFFFFGVLRIAKAIMSLFIFKPVAFLLVTMESG